MAKYAKNMVIAKPTPKVYWGNSASASSTAYYETLNIEQPSGYTLKDVEYGANGKLTLIFEPDKTYVTADKWSNWISGKDYSDLYNASMYQTEKKSVMKSIKMEKMRKLNEELDSNRTTLSLYLSGGFTSTYDFINEWKVQWK
jgi:hypothetical protein